VQVRCHYHKDLPRLLYPTNSDKIGIKGGSAEILVGHAPSGKLDAKCVLALLAGNCLDHHHEEMFLSVLAVSMIHSGAGDGAGNSLGAATLHLKV
jgi:hypothetical protein